MLLIASLAVPAAFAGSPDATKVCTAEGRVALSAGLQRRIRTKDCPSVVSSEAVANFMKAFALYTKELVEPGNAARLARTVDARWVLVEDGPDYLVYDVQADAFVDPAVFAAGPPGAPAQAESPEQTAYRLGYQALRGKRYDEARTQLSTCIEHAPDHAGCHWELGWVHWVAEDWSAAAASWGEVAKHEPEHPELDVWLPKAQAKAGVVTDP